MRITASTCLIGVLALAGFPGLSGFWSKDAILGAALESGSPLGKIALAVGILVAALTAFYAMRMWMLAFAGEPRSDTAAHAHESPLEMTAPLVLLAIPSVLLGGYLHTGNRFAAFMTGGQAQAEPMHGWLVGVTSLAALGGLALAWRLYGTAKAMEDPVKRVPGYTLFANLWYIDAFWNAVGARGVLAVGRAVAWFDRNIVDGAVNGVGALCQVSGRELRRAANGQAQSYAAAFVAAIVLAILLFALYQTRATLPDSAAISRPVVKRLAGY
jgi:NADH-quinone oxidoreductase subunit L